MRGSAGRGHLVHRMRVRPRTWRSRVVAGVAAGGLALVSSILAAPAAVADTAPSNSVAPAVSGAQANGDVYVGSTLFATAGRWIGDPAPTYTYRWQYLASNGNWPDIPGATAPSYTVQPGDLGNYLRVNVTATNSVTSVERASDQTASKVTNGPFQPDGPVNPPPDVLGSPLNSRVVSADSLLLTRDVRTDEDGHFFGAQTNFTTGTGTVDFSTVADAIGEPTAEYPHDDPNPTAVGRFLDQDFDSVLMLRQNDLPTTFEEGSALLELNSVSALARTIPTTEFTQITSGDTYLMSAASSPSQRIREVDQPDGDSSNVALVPESAAEEQVPAAVSWSAVALPGFAADTFALVNRATGRCLSVTGATPILAAYACAWGAVPSAQQWKVTGSGVTYSLVNAATNLAVAHTAADPLTLAPVNPSDPAQLWRTFKLESLADNPPAPLQRGSDVPTYTAALSTTPLTWALAAGDLDRVSEFGDTYTYHDEAVMMWLPFSPNESPQTPQVRVVDYVSSGQVAPVTVDLPTALPAPGAVQSMNGFPTWNPGSVGLAVGDFDGDSLNEIAYVWQDGTGTFQVTFLEYRRQADQSRTLAVVGSTLPLFGGSGFPTGSLNTGAADIKAADYDGDGRDDLSIAFPGTGADGIVNGYLGVATFTQDLGLRGQVAQALTESTAPLYLGIQDEGTDAHRGLTVAPGLFRFDPEAGYTMERRQLSVAYSMDVGGTMVTALGVYSAEPDPSCSQATCSLTFADLGGLVLHSAPFIGDGAYYDLPISLTAGGFSGRGTGEDPPIWGIAVALNDVGENVAGGAMPDGHLYNIAMAPPAGGGTAVPTLLQDILLSGNSTWGAPDRWAVNAYDPLGASLMLGAPAVVQVQQLKKATMIGAQPPVHADWNWAEQDPVTKQPGAFVDVSRFSNFTVTLGSTTGTTYQHSYTHTTGWNGGVTESTDVKGSFNNDIEVEATSASVEAKQKFQKKWEGGGSDFNDSESTTSVSLSQTSDDDDIFQGVIENTTLYRYPILGGLLTNPDGTPVGGSNCGTTCYGVWEVTIPGQVTPLNTSGRLVDFYQPTWENGNALSYPVISATTGIPTPDQGGYTYVDQDGNTQTVNTPLISQEFGVGGSSTKQSMQITTNRGTGNSTNTGNSWQLTANVKATATYRMGPKAINYAGSVTASIGGFGGQSTSTDTVGKTIDTSGSSFQLNVPEIESNLGYNIGTAYYYDTSGAPRVSMAVDLTSASTGSGDWWADNYGELPDPALNLPNRITLGTSQYTGQENVPQFVAEASQQAIRGFEALHTANVSSPSFANKPYTLNPVQGQEVVFQIPVRNYSLVPVSNVDVQFYALPMTYDGIVPVPDGDPTPIGAPQRIDQIAAQGSENVASPVWTADMAGLSAGVRLWRIFAVLDPANTIGEIHEWKDGNGACPVDSLESTPGNGTVINGVMVDPMTGKASTLACGQNNQGFGQITVAATAGSDTGADAAGTTTVLALAQQAQAAEAVEPGAPGVNLTVGGVRTDDPGTDVIDPGEVARVKVGQRVQAGAHVAAAGESPYHQTVLVYDGTPETGELVAVTTLHGATAAGDSIVPFTWVPKQAGLHTLTVKLLGHIAAGEDDQLTIPIQVDAVEPPPTTTPTPTPTTTAEPTATTTAEPTSTAATPTPTTATYAAYAVPSPYANKANGELSYTGAGPLPALLALGFGLLAVGTTMLVSTRRRRVRMRTAGASLGFRR